MSRGSVVSSNRIICTPSAFARASLLHLQEIGSLTALQAHTNKRSNLQSFLLLRVVEGEGKLLYNGKTFTLYPGSCAFLDCMKPYAHTTEEGNLWTIQWIHFYGPTAVAIYDQYREQGGRTVFAEDSRHRIAGIWGELMELASSSDHLRDMKINRLLAELMVVLMAETERSEGEIIDSPKFNVEEIKTYLDEHFSEKISIKDLASCFLVSSSYLAHRFKMQYGMSITTYLQSVRITQAKQLLRFSDKRVEDIGYEVGIGAPTYFSRVFKSVEGISPKQFRQQW